MSQLLKLLITSLIVILITFSLTDSFHPALAATSRRNVLPKNGAPTLSGNIKGEEWLSALADSKIAYCNGAYSAFRASPSQSYIISSNVQSLTASGLCDRIDQYFSLEENLDSRLSTAAAIAPLLFADTPLGTNYNGLQISE
jgi:hypothetical protein